MDVNYDKLLTAIELTAYNKLDECRDDTLIEKLVTIFDSSFEKLNCTDKQLNAIFDLCKEAIDLWSDKTNLNNRSKVFIGPVFSFIFKLLSSPDLQNVIGKSKVVKQLKELINLKLEVFNCDYSIQSYYIKGLCKLFLNLNGSRIVFEENLISESYVENLINLGLDSKSFFVRESIQQLLIELIRRSCELKEKRTLNYLNLIVSSLEFKLNKFQIKILNQLLEEEEEENKLIKLRILKLLPNLYQILISHISANEDNINLQLIELLANNLDDESQINFVFIKLIKNNLLKPLIIYSSKLASRNIIYLNKWFIYLVLPLELECSNNNNNSNNQIINNYFQYTDNDKLIVSSLTNEKSLIYSLHYLKTQFPKQLTDNQLDQVFEIINQFIRNLIKESKIKLLRESLLMIGNLSKQIQNKSKLFLILIDLLINLLWSTEQFQCECLIWLRHLFNNNYELIKNKEIKLKLMNLLDRLLNLELKDENLDLVDGGLELIDILIKTNQLKLAELDDSQLKLIFNIWNYSTKHSDNYSLKASCISILFNLNIELESESISKLCSDIGDDLNGNSLIINQIKSNTNLLEIIWKCLKDENSLVRRKVIESIRDAVLNENIQIKNDLINKLIENDGRLYLDICYYVSESILFDIDSDIQLTSMELLKNLILNLLSSNQFKEEENLKRIKYCGLIYFIHSLHFTIMNNLICFTVKEQCLNILELIKNYLNENSIDQENLNSILKDKNVSIFEYKVSGFNKKITSNELDNNLELKKDNQLNEMFKDNLFHPEEIILQLTNERTKEQLNSSKEQIQTSITNQINTSKLLEFLFNFDVKNYLNNEIKIDFLDDILAAKANEDVILDCY